MFTIEVKTQLKQTTDYSCQILDIYINNVLRIQNEQIIKIEIKNSTGIKGTERAYLFQIDYLTYVNPAYGVILNTVSGKGFPSL